MADLTTRVNGLTLPNPFVIGSGPPGTNANVIGKAFDEGWGAVIAKTISLDASKVINVSPRYARLRADQSREIFGWQNIELISDRPFETWIEEFKQLKQKYPDGILIASIMEEYRKDAWVEIVERVQKTGVDAFELNFSCPHGLPERKMGAAMGEDPSILEEVCGWVNEVATIPVWAKMTPNITHIEDPARAALRAGCEGVSAINTILCVMGVDLETLRPEPTVEGHTVPGGYSCKAVRPIALRMVMQLATMMRREFPAESNETVREVAMNGVLAGAGARAASKPTGSPADSARMGTPSSPMGRSARSLSAIGGIETGTDAAQFILLGGDTVQVCTGVMKHGYEVVKPMIDGLKAFMDKKGFATLDEFRGHSLQYFTTHADLVQRQAAATAAKRTAAGVVKKDTDWQGDKFVAQSEALARN